MNLVRAVTHSRQGPVDLGDVGASEKAVDVARHVARRDGSRISVVSVVPAWPEDLSRTPHDYEPELGAYIDAAREGADMEGEVKVGKPTVEGATVTGQVLGEHRGKKIVIFRFKRRKNVRRKTGHRQTYTRVRITDIQA